MIRLKLGAKVSKWFGAHFRPGPEVSRYFGTNFVVPKYLLADVSGSQYTGTDAVFLVVSSECVTHPVRLRQTLSKLPSSAQLSLLPLVERE